jgi:hypothetical protein
MKKLFVCLFITAFLPIAASPVKNSSVNSVPFPSTAFAGHSVVGSWCECGSSVDCFCDPGETPNGQSVSRNTQNQEQPPADETPEAGMEFGAVALMLVFFALTLSRLRG